MTRSRLGLKALGICAVLVGVMGFAGVAQAGYWLVNEKEFTEESKLLPILEAEMNVERVLLFELGGKFIHVTCSSFKLVGAHLLESSVQLLGKRLFHGCQFWTLLTPGGVKHVLASCEPLIGSNKGLIETNLVVGIIKSEGLEIKPAVKGQPLVTLNVGEECAFGEMITVEGVILMEDTALGKNAVKHLFEELNELTLLKINGGAKVAAFDGSFSLFLGGAHTGMTFSGQS